MKLSRIIEVGLFVGVLFLLGALDVSETALAQTNWDTQANEHRGKNGQQFTYVCPGNGTISSRLWGSDIYTDDSSVCTAAVHAGLITREAGGTVTIEIRPGEQSYRSESRVSISGSETITSTAYGPYAGSFVFVRAGTINPPQQTNRPPNAPTLLSPANTYPSFQPPVAVNSQQPYVVLSWQNNGDPDNDTLSFALDIRYFDSAAQVWKQVFNQYVQGTSFTLAPPLFAYGYYYSWGVVAVETNRGNSALSTPSGWSYFSTPSNPQGGGDVIIDIKP